MNGIVKWLKDKEDNILIPNTLTSAVFNAEGKSVDELLNNSSSTNITIDSELSSESENPVQNKVITSELDKKIAILEMPTGQNLDLLLADDYTVYHAKDGHASMGIPDDVSGFYDLIVSGSTNSNKYYQQLFNNDKIYFRSAKVDTGIDIDVHYTYQYQLPSDFNGYSGNALYIKCGDVEYGKLTGDEKCFVLIEEATSTIKVYNTKQGRTMIKAEYVNGAYSSWDMKDGNVTYSSASFDLGTPTYTYDNVQGLCSSVIPFFLDTQTEDILNFLNNGDKSAALNYQDIILSWSDWRLLSNPITEEDIDKKIADLVNSAPETLDTLGEIAQAIEENQDVVDALDSAITNKVDKEEGKGLFSGSYKDLTDTPTLVAGENVTISNDESTNKITISSSVDKASVVNTVSGNNPTAENSTDGNLIYLKDSGYTEQKVEKYLTEFSSSGDFLRTNKIPCKKGDTVAFTSTIEYDSIYMFIYNGETEITSLADVNVNKLEVTIPSSDATHVVFEIEVGGIVGGNGATTNTNTVTVNGNEYIQPSPDTPIHIDGLADKGYFDGELRQGYYFKDDGVYKDNGKQQDICCKNPIAVNGNDKVAINYDGKTNAIRILYYDESDTFISSNMIGTTSGTPTTSSAEFTAPSNCKYIRFNMYDAVSITPSTAKHICVTINGMYALRVKTSIWDDELLQGYRAASSGIYEYYYNHITSKNGIVCESGNIIKLEYEEVAETLNLVFYDKDNVYITGSYSENVNVHEAVAPPNAKYVYFTVKKVAITPTTAKNISITINGQGETEALIPVSAPFYTGDYIDVYADGTGREYRVNKELEVTKWDNQQNTLTNSKELRTSIISDRKVGTIYCNIASYVPTTWGKDELGICSWANAELSQISVRVPLDADKTNYPCKFVYKLATPTSTPLTAEQVAEFMKLQTFKGVTHVTADGEVVMRYYCDNASGETVSMLQDMVEKTNEVVAKVENLGGAFEVFDVTSVSISVSSGQTTTVLLPISANGYTALGIVGAYTNVDGVGVGSIAMDIDRVKASVKVTNNTSATKSAKVTIQVLYIK